MSMQPRFLSSPRALNVSRAEVHGVISFYHDFRSEPAGTHVLKLCRAEACQSMGAAALEQRLSTRHGLKLGDTTPDGRLTVEGVYCLGNCACRRPPSSTMR
jgi:formate dehydrogenase subunit gamma